MTTTTTEQETGPSTIEVGVRICEDCLRLKGETCNNAECVFCRRTMAEVGHYLDVLLIAPVIDGERIFLPVNSHAELERERDALKLALRKIARTTCKRGSGDQTCVAVYAIAVKGHYTETFRQELLSSMCTTCIARTALGETK
jgi:hypothetical protein